MKKVFGILAVMTLMTGMYSCDTDSANQDDALYQTQADASQEECDSCELPTDDRD